MASNQGHIKVVKRLLAAGADVNRPSSSYGTSLDFAARKGHIEIVRALLASGARVREETLLAAAAQGRELLELLQKARAAQSDAGMEVSADMLIRASHGKDTSGLELLLEEEPDLEARNKNGQTALVLAGFNGRLDAIRVLLDAGADVNQTSQNGWTALMRASYSGHIEVMKFLIAQGADVNAGTYVTALSWAAENGLLEAVDLLLESGADVNAVTPGQPRGTVLSKAVQRRHVTVVRRLLEAGADPRVTSPLCAAAWGGQLELVNLLLDAGAPANDEACAPLSAAARSGRLDIVTRLLDEGADPARADSALHNAAVRGASDVVSLLIERGMDVNAVDASSGGMTSLHRAVLSQSLETVRMLLDAGADVDAKAEHGTTPLMIALPYDRRDVLAREEQRRWSPDWTDPRLAMIELLLEAGADVNAVDGYERTVLAQAEAVEDTAIVRLLREAASERGR